MWKKILLFGLVGFGSGASAAAGAGGDENTSIISGAVAAGNAIAALFTEKPTKKRKSGSAVRVGVIFALALGLAAISSAQTVQNPRAVEFDTADHDAFTGYKVDIVALPSTTVIQTIAIDKASAQSCAVVTCESASAEGLPRYRAALNLQPIAFGSYYGVIRGVMPDGTETPNSDASGSFVRAPGRPSALTFK